MSIPLIFTIIIIHWFADFVLQTHEQAVNKSTDNWYLTKHVWSYTSAWMVIFGLFAMFNNHMTGLDNSYYGITVQILWFFPITFVAHWITDYFTSRLNSYFWKKGDTHNFFVSVGFDQVLHYIQLFGTIWLLT